MIFEKILENKNYRLISILPVLVIKKDYFKKLASNID